jgi:hypothetical protein
MGPQILMITLASSVPTADDRVMVQSERLKPRGQDSGQRAVGHFSTSEGEERPGDGLWLESGPDHWKS